MLPTNANEIDNLYVAPTRDYIISSIDNTVGEERSGRMGDVMIMMLNNVSGPDSMNRSDTLSQHYLQCEDLLRRTV